MSFEDIDFEDHELMQRLYLENLKRKYDTFRADHPRCPIPMNYVDVEDPKIQICMRLVENNDVEGLRQAIADDRPFTDSLTHIALDQGNLSILKLLIANGCCIDDHESSYLYTRFPHIFNWLKKHEAELHINVDYYVRKEEKERRRRWKEDEELFDYMDYLDDMGGLCMQKIDLALD